MPLFAQDLIHKFELGAGHRVLKLVVAVIAVVALALFYNMAAFRNFATPEAMDSAQLARNISEGKGFTTDFVRPLSIYLFKKQARSGGSPTNSLPDILERSPDISNPPVYPLLLAGILKLMPFNYPELRGQRSFTTYSPEVWIAGFNQLLLLLCAGLIFTLARRLFDESVAWVSAVVFVGAELFWRHSVSGLPTLWLTALILVIALLLVRLDTRLRDPNAPAGWPILIAALLGLLAGLAGLTRYSFLFLIIPLLIYLVTVPSPRRVTLALAASVVFLAVVIPWLVRNYSVSGTLFGTASYAVLVDTPQFPGSSIYRSTAPDFATLSTSDVMRKVLLNLRHILVHEVPSLGGSWIAALFLAGLLVPFRNPVTARIRLLLVGLIVALLFAQAAIAPASVAGAEAEAKPNNYLSVVAPLVFIFGVGLLFTLLEQFTAGALRYSIVSVVGVLACAPLALTFAAPPHSASAFPPYHPPWIQRKALHLPEDHWLMSDIPWAVAWYGDRQAVWLSLRHGNPGAPAANDFYSIHQYKPVHGLHLSAVTLQTLDAEAITTWRADDRSDADWDTFRQRLKSVADALPSNQQGGAVDSLMQAYSLAEKHWVTGGGQSWESFVLGIFVAREVPTGFPLKVAPEGLTPEIFLTDSERPAPKTIKPSEQAQKP